MQAPAIPFRSALLPAPLTPGYDPWWTAEFVKPVRRRNWAGHFSSANTGRRFCAPAKKGPHEVAAGTNGKKKPVGAALGHQPYLNPEPG